MVRNAPPKDGRKLDHKTLEEIRMRAVRRVLEGESPEVVIASVGMQDTPLRLGSLPNDYYTAFARTREAIGWIEEPRMEKPFFLYLAYTAPHWPLSPKPEYIERAKGIYKDGWDAARAAFSTNGRRAFPMGSPRWTPIKSGRKVPVIENALRSRLVFVGRAMRDSSAGSCRRASPFHTQISQFFPGTDE